MIFSWTNSPLLSREWLHSWEFWYSHCKCLLWFSYLWLLSVRWSFIYFVFFSWTERKWNTGACNRSYQSTSRSLQCYSRWNISCWYEVHTNSMIWQQSYIKLFFSLLQKYVPWCRDQYDTWNLLARARNEGRLFTKLRWPKDPEMVHWWYILFIVKGYNCYSLILSYGLQKALVKRLYSLLTINDSTAQHVPRNLEARRRLQFFTNSLFMDVPQPKPVHQMLSFRYFLYHTSIILSKFISSSEAYCTFL